MALLLAHLNPLVYFSFPYSEDAVVGGRPPLLSTIDIPHDGDRKTHVDFERKDDWFSSLLPPKLCSGK
jgi:hypothetical protein